MYRVGQPSAALPRCGCCMPLAGEGGVRACARRRVSERNRRKAALSAEITQEGETGDAPPVADEASMFRGRPPNSEYAVSAVWLGPTVEGEVPPGAKRLFRHVEAAIADGHSPFCGGCFFCGAAWAILLRKNGFSPGFVKFLPKFKKVLASYTGVRCMILSRKKRPDTEEMLAGAAPVTFRVEKRTFHADGPARRGKDATLSV